MTTDPIVFVVDDDPSVRSSLKFLIGTVGLHVETFDSAETALQRLSPDAPSCLVLDVRLRGLSGLDLQNKLAKKLPGADSLYYGSRRHPNECSRYEGGGNRIPH